MSYAELDILSPTWLNARYFALSCGTGQTKTVPGGMRHGFRGQTAKTKSRDGGCFGFCSYRLLVWCPGRFGGGGCSGCPGRLGSCGRSWRGSRSGSECGDVGSATRAGFREGHARDYGDDLAAFGALFRSCRYVSWSKTHRYFSSRIDAFCRYGIDFRIVARASDAARLRSAPIAALLQALPSECAHCRISCESPLLKML